MGRALRILSVTLITAGIVILVDAAVTIAWKEPLSAVYSSFKQRAADDQLDTAKREFLADPEVLELGSTDDVRKRVEELADIYAERLSEGDAFGRIVAPSMGADFVVIQGTRTADLQKGPGHYPTTALPGQGRTVAIAGHRTTYGAPFREIDKVEEGDEITLEMPYADIVYEVTETRIVDPGDVGIVDDVGRERLVLTACHPLYSAAQRYAVFADVRDASLFPGGEQRWPAP
jgi:sortase A